MPLFYFHLCEGDDILVDEEGRQFSDDEAIRKAALIEARSIISDEAKSGLINLNLRIDVEDERRTHVLSLAFHEAVQIIPAMQRRQDLHA